ncbi:MAG: hypothetical protein ABI120_15610 [Gemmatimonadaceae bacterium]
MSEIAPQKIRATVLLDGEALESKRNNFERCELLRIAAVDRHFVHVESAAHFGEEINRFVALGEHCIPIFTRERCELAMCVRLLVVNLDVARHDGCVTLPPLVLAALAILLPCTDHSRLSARFRRTL